MSSFDESAYEDPFAGVPNVDERLADWVDGTMSQRDRDRFEAEMRVSPTLREQVAAYEATVDSIRAALGAPTFGTPTQDAAFADRVMSSLAQHASTGRKHRRSPWPLLWAALSAAALLGIAIWVDQWGGGVSAPADQNDSIARFTPPMQADVEVAEALDSHAGESLNSDASPSPKGVEDLGTAYEARSEAGLGVVPETLSKDKDLTGNAPAGNVPAGNVPAGNVPAGNAPKKGSGRGASGDPVVAQRGKSAPAKPGSVSGGLPNLGGSREGTPAIPPASPSPDAPSQVPTPIAVGGGGAGGNAGNTNSGPQSPGPAGPGATVRPRMRVPGATRGGSGAAPKTAADSRDKADDRSKNGGALLERELSQERRFLMRLSRDVAKGDLLPMVSIEGYAVSPKASQPVPQGSKTGQFELGRAREHGASSESAKDPAVKQSLQAFFEQQMRGDAAWSKQPAESLEANEATEQLMQSHAVAIAGLQFFAIGPADAASSEAADSKMLLGAGASSDARESDRAKSKGMEAPGQPGTPGQPGAPGRPKAAGGDRVQRDWLVIGSAKQVAAMLVALRDYSDASRMLLGGGELRVVKQQPLPGLAAGSAPPDRERPAAPPSPSSFSAAPDGIRRVVLRFRVRR
jgi:hypothetical protein